MTNHMTIRLHCTLQHYTVYFPSVYVPSSSFNLVDCLHKNMENMPHMAAMYSVVSLIMNIRWSKHVEGKKN